MEFTGLEHYGLFGAIVFMVITNLFSIVKTTIQERNGCNPTKLSNRTEDIQDKMNFVYDVCKQTDTDGVPKLFTREQFVYDVRKSVKNTDEIKNELMVVIRDHN